MTTHLCSLLRKPDGIVAQRGGRLLRGIVFAVLGLLAASMARADVSKEYLVKAAFLYNFTKFVEWPADRFVDAEAPIVIGLFGKHSFGNELENVVRDRRVNGRAIKIVALRAVDEAAEVHVLFVPAGEERRIHLDDRALRGVLTVGETAHFGVEDGIVNFTMVEDKVRFEINADAAERAGLKISAQLKKLATTVRRKSADSR